MAQVNVAHLALNWPLLMNFWGVCVHNRSYSFFYFLLLFLTKVSSFRHNWAVIYSYKYIAHVKKNRDVLQQKLFFWLLVSWIKAMRTDCEISRAPYSPPDPSPWADGIFRTISFSLLLPKFPGSVKWSK